ncbi:S41 family peptidase [Ahniella affigens]|nr:S41 family peptidase [Ahniella affigens]
MAGNRVIKAIALILLLHVGHVHAERFTEAMDQAVQHMLAKQWPEAVSAFDRAASLGNLDAGQQYNFACVLALSGDHDRALTALEAAVNAGYTDTDHMQRDADLASLRTDPRFNAVIEHAGALLAFDQRVYGAKAIETPFAKSLPEAERIAGLSRLWSEAKYNFANFDLVPKLDWDALYLQTLPKVQRSSNTADYYRELIAFVAQLQDGHSGVFPPAALNDTFYARPPLRTRLIENRVLVTEVFHKSLTDQGLRPGTEILAINGKSVHQYVSESVVPWVSASTPQDRDQRSFGFQLLQGDLDQDLDLRIQNAGEDATDINVARWSQAQRSALKVSGKPSFSWKMLPDNIAYVALNEFESDQAATQYLANFERISKAKAIIFDVRRNGGGNGGEGYRVLATLTDQPIPTSRWQTRKYVPAWRAWGLVQTPIAESNSWSADGERHYQGQVLVLTSAETYSAAEDFVGAFKNMGRGKIVGEATGGSTGQPLFLALPGGGGARICAKRDRLADGTEFVGHGIHPDIPSAETVDGFRAGRDTVLDTAIAAIK